MADEPRQLPADPEAKEMNLGTGKVPSQSPPSAIQRWKEENRSAIEAQNAWIAEHGLPLAKYRQF